MAFSEGLKEEFKKPLTQEVWDNIIDYEKSWYRANNLQSIPIAKLIHYFGEENICKMYGCEVVDGEIAKILIKKEFEK